MKHRFLVSLAVSVLACSLVCAGGPDSGGYRWIDSDTAGGPAFEWVDISANGTQVLLGDDDNQGPFDLGFEFPFYDSSFSAVRLCSNGWLSFVSTSHQFHHYPIPDPGDPNALLAPFWTDLDPSTAGTVLYLVDTANARFIVSWLDVPFYDRADSCTFQVILDTSGTILFHYLKVPNLIDSCSVGIENPQGLVGLEYFHDGQPTQNQVQDSLAIRFFRLDRDVSPVAIGRPFDRELAGGAVTPTVVVWNPGRLPVSFPVTVRIGAGYEQQISVADLASLRDTVLQFPAWIPGVDSYPVEVFTALIGDESGANDTIRSRTATSYQGELRYDDGARDTWFIRVGAPSTDWAAAVRFTPPYSEYRLLSASIFVSDTMLFRRVLVCPDSSGAPGLSHPYFQAESVAGTQPQAWLQLDLDTVLSTGGDVWLVAFWPGRVTGPEIGDDRTRPVDHRTFFGAPRAGWFAYDQGDLMMRLRVEGSAGIAELKPGSPLNLMVSPNPFSHQVRFRGSPGFSAEVYDIGGRRVSRLTGPDGKATWTPGTLPHGVYLAHVLDSANRAGSSCPVIKLVYTE